MECNWKEEFDESYEVPEIISEALLDQSWHNNICPSFSNDDDEITLWCEHPDFDQREMQEDYRYSVSVWYDDGRILWTGNDPKEALQAYEFHASEYRRDKKIALEFIRLLIEEIGTDNFFEMLNRNRFEMDSGVCHSHDFCDANMVMDQAFTNVMGRETDVCDGINDANDTQIWNRAWDMAKYHLFYEEEQRMKDKKE